jgi:hypothetical protein
MQFWPSSRELACPLVGYACRKVAVGFHVGDTKGASHRLVSGKIFLENAR